MVAVFKFILSDMRGFGPAAAAHKDGQIYTEPEMVLLLKSRDRVYPRGSLAYKWPLLFWAPRLVGLSELLLFR